MSFWLKIGLVGGLIVIALSYHILSKRNAVESAVEAQRAIYELRVQEEVNKAKEISISLLNSAIEDLKKKDEQLKTINNKYSDLYSRMQQRPSRKDSPKSTKGGGTCTGAELSREDGEFLAREAARADKILKERDYYYEQYRRAEEALASH